MFEGQYERYLMNRLREELPFSEVPIRLLFTKRQRKSLEELKQDGRAATIQPITRLNPSVGQVIDGVETLPDDSLE
jgi:hypothetical protein